MIDPLSAFKIKPFDLEPIYASWLDGPRFFGNPKKDVLSVDSWLEQIKAGCVARKVPEEYWHRVGQHFMEGNAKIRLEELKKVMAKVHGGKYRWNWKKFSLAMRNMGWDIDSNAKETLKVRKKGSGWWVTRKKDEEQVVYIAAPAPAPPTKSKTIDWISRKMDDKAVERPVPIKSHSVSEVALVSETRSRPPPPSRSGTTDSTTTVTNAPVWLLNATQALDLLVTEHPKVMSTLSAILITLGTIPAIPAISAGAGGAILASGTAHAVGAIAVGVGSWMKAHQDSRARSASTSSTG